MTEILYDRYQWDRAKESANIDKHGISFVHAVKAFADPFRVIFIDDKHSEQESRWFCVGKVEDDIITVRFTFRDKSVRIIGAGIWRMGRKIYEQKKIETKES